MPKSKFRIGPRKPKRQKTYEEIMRHDDGELIVLDNGIYLYIDEEPAMKTYGEMLAGFYRANEDLQPIAFDQVVDKASATDSKDWYAVMYRGWHIRIFQGPNLPGPHSCQLWYKSGTPQPKRNHWIATLQLMAFYFNRDEMLAALLLAIKEKEFWMSDREKTYTLLP